jgi:hypothetical protein
MGALVSFEFIRMISLVDGNNIFVYFGRDFLVFGIAFPIYI